MLDENLTLLSCTHGHKAPGPIQRP